MAPGPPILSMSDDHPAHATADPARFREALARFDSANAEDPRTEVADGEALPYELLYARRMSARLEAFAPEASEAVRLAARSQHIRRWTIPRSAYPTGRIGYKQWRNALLKFHAETAGAILRAVGYDDATVERVQTLLQKQRLKRDPDVQTLEDVICLVFLEHYFADFAGQHDDDKLVGILRKTWAKMSPAGHDAALALALPPPLRALVEKALAAV
jgi:hypothetical protein